MMAYSPEKNSIGTVTNSGIKINKNKIMTSTIRNGVMALIKRSILILPAPIATFRTVPTGGVRSPITLFNTNNRPK
jgi:hypothetical protein